MLNMTDVGSLSGEILQTKNTLTEIYNTVSQEKGARYANPSHIQPYDYIRKRFWNKYANNINIEEGFNLNHHFYHFRKTSNQNFRTETLVTHVSPHFLCNQRVNINNPNLTEKKKTDNVQGRAKRNTYQQPVR